MHHAETVVRQMTAVDLFAGAGGASTGLSFAGFCVLAAVESDAAAARSYARNHPDTQLYDSDIRRIQAPALARRLPRDLRVDLLTACPPCQGFSTLGRGDKDDERNNLVGSLGRFVRALRPRAILLENVPGLAADRRLGHLEQTLTENYVVARWLIDAAEFGVPQHRRRLIVMAIERPFDPGHLAYPLPALLPPGFDVRPRTAGAAIAAAGPLGSDDPVHQARRSTQLTLERIDAMPVGGGRNDLPARLRLACHDRLTGKHATSIYGRIDPDRPAPAMTTRCTTPSCGRFVHPSERRGLSLREAAMLQTFPRDYAFEGTYGEIERQIGNAVPVRLAEALGRILHGILSTQPSRGRTADQTRRGRVTESR